MDIWGQQPDLCRGNKDQGRKGRFLGELSCAAGTRAWWGRHLPHKVQEAHSPRGRRHRAPRLDPKPLHPSRPRQGGTALGISGPHVRKARPVPEPVPGAQLRCLGSSVVLFLFMASLLGQERLVLLMRRKDLAFHCFCTMCTCPVFAGLHGDPRGRAGVDAAVTGLPSLRTCPDAHLPGPRVSGDHRLLPPPHASHRTSSILHRCVLAGFQHALGIQGQCCSGGREGDLQSLLTWCG